MRRRNVPCSPCSGGSSGSCDCCGIKEKLRILWDRTIGSILRINGISPDGNGDFTIEAGDNIALSERGTGNGIRIDTTGAVSYYSSGDSYVNVDNNNLEITVNVGTGGLATDNDLQTVAGAVADILDGTTTIPKAGTADALALAGMDTTPTLGSDKAVTSDGILTALNGKQNTITAPTLIKNQSGIKVYRWGQMVIVSLEGYNSGTTSAVTVFTDMPTATAYSNSAIGDQNANVDGFVWIEPPNVNNLVVRQHTVTNHWGEMVYITSDP